jgi:uncharacterized protein (TIGR02145 family)
MGKHFNFKLINFVTLLSVVMVLITCKKSKDSVTSNPSAPTVSTLSAEWVGQTWATMKGTVNAKSLSTKATFEYDTTTAYGYSINAIPDTMSGNTYITVRSSLTGLTANTKYHYRVKAVNSVGTSYGSDITFTTSDTVGTIIIFNPDLTYGSVSDIDSNTYRTIQIGTQTWTAENLKSIKYNDGTDIPFVTDVSAWAALSTPGYCWYNNDSVACGAIYNWHAVNTGKLCPTGWHVPTDAEWTILTDYLGGQSVSGGKLKETGTTHWLSPNTGATNESGFTAIPGGYRSYAGVFNGIGSYGFWWTSTEGLTAGAYYRDTYYGYNSSDRSNSSKKSGLSVRCLKN